MPKRVCVSCTVPLTNDNISREHILPEWVAAEVHQPELSLKHYRHNEDAALVIRNAVLIAQAEMTERSSGASCNMLVFIFIKPRRIGLALPSRSLIQPLLQP